MTRALQNDPGIVLGSEFDAVDMVRFTVTDPNTGAVNASNVFCFGMDEFFINEPAPTPEPGILALLASGMIGMIGVIRLRKRALK